MRPLRPLVAILALALLAGCRPDRAPADAPREGALVPGSDTVVTPGPFYDPEAAVTSGNWEATARTTILQDEAVREAQVILVTDTVRITAVLSPVPEDRLLRLKAEQFVAAAMREVERETGAPGPELLGPTRYVYHVSLRTDAGERAFDGVKPAASSEIVAR